MLGKRSVYMTVALVAMLLAGRTFAPVLNQALVLNPGLRKAISSFDLDRARELIGRGADVNVSLPSPQRNWPESAIGLAVWAGDPGALQSFLKAGAKPDLRNAAGATPLMLASSMDSTDVVRVLIAAGADPNARDKLGETALMYAASHGSLTYVGGARLYHDAEFARLLLAAGADPTPCDSNGESALSKAEQSGEREIASALRSVGAKGLRDELSGTAQADLFYAVRTQDLGAVKRLIHKGARVAVQDKNGVTPLMYAAVQYDGILLRYLLLHAPDVQAALELRDNVGRTALYRTLSAWDYSFRLLLKAGADPNGTGPNGESYYRFANRAHQKLLVQAGAAPPPN